MVNKNRLESTQRVPTDRLLIRWLIWIRLLPLSKLKYHICLIDWALHGHDC
jgi:hypothetical protein